MADPRQNYKHDRGGAFPDNYMYYFMLALMNSSVMSMYIKMLNPSVTTQVGDVERVPFAYTHLHLK